MTGGMKLWDAVLRLKRVAQMRPVLEAVLRGSGAQRMDLETRSTSARISMRAPRFSTFETYARSGMAR